MQIICILWFMKYEPPLQLLIKTAGGPVAIARIIGVVPSAVTQWRRVPLKHVPKLAEVTGLSCHQIRPDFFPEAGFKPADEEAA
jgi:DNA-binding transcriptional regulator YdaS (Cro superfamily)